MSHLVKSTFANVLCIASSLIKVEPDWFENRWTRPSLSVFNRIEGDISARLHWIEKRKIYHQRRRRRLRMNGKFSKSDWRPLTLSHSHILILLLINFLSLSLSLLFSLSYTHQHIISFLLNRTHWYPLQLSISQFSSVGSKGVRGCTRILYLSHFFFHHLSLSLSHSLFLTLTSHRLKIFPI